MCGFCQRKLLQSFSTSAIYQDGKLVRQCAVRRETRPSQGPIFEVFCEKLESTEEVQSNEGNQHFLPKKER
jgi:hypothetical protein